MEVEVVTHTLHWIASRGDSQTKLAIILTDLMRLLQKVKSGMGSPDWMCRWSTLTFENPCGCTARDMPGWRGMTEQVDWRAKQPSQVACLSEDLKCWGAWDTTCGHKAKDTTPSIAWRREACKEETLDDLPWKDERGPSSVRRTLKLFQKKRSGNFWTTGWSACGFFRALWYHLDLNWTQLCNQVSAYGDLVSSWYLQWCNQLGQRRKVLKTFRFSQYFHPN